MEDLPKLEIKEVEVTLKKYDGEYTPEKYPVEIIVMRDGKIVSHWKKEKN